LQKKQQRYGKGEKERLLLLLYWKVAVLLYSRLKLFSQEESARAGGGVAN
jgi:hypothetical protein